MSNMEMLVGLSPLICGECGIPFAVPDSYIANKRDGKGRNWHCPNGHSRVFTITNDQKLEEAQKELEEAQKELERERRNSEGWRTSARAEARRVERQKKQIARLKLQLEEAKA